MIILQWIIWTIALSVFIFSLYGARESAKRGISISFLVFLHTIFLLIIVIFFLFSSLNKFHLLWAIPACFISSMLIGLIVIPTPIIGDILRDVSLIFAYILLVGTKWEIAGLPPENATFRMLKKIIKRGKYNTITDFETAIKKYENHLFGIRLFNEGIKRLYSWHKGLVDSNEGSFRNIMDRGEEALSEAKNLLENIKNRKEDIKVIKFKFPVILDEMTQRATLLIETYEKLFPGRPKNIPLTPEENEILMKEVIKKY
ncbi:hypothetical protein KJ633_02370 [bacterium]|nr:hypothetical protein [bacterium]MBU3955284.1 hypothetical protein [bacterium]